MIHEIPASKSCQGILSDQGFLEGPSAVENARFGMAISAVPDLNLDGFSDVVVGAPLEDNSRGVVYVYFGDKTTVRLQHSQVDIASDNILIIPHINSSCHRIETLM